MGIWRRSEKTLRKGSDQEKIQMVDLFGIPETKSHFLYIWKNTQTSLEHIQARA